MDKYILVRREVAVMKVLDQTRDRLTRASPKATINTGWSLPVHASSFLISLF